MAQIALLQRHPCHHRRRPAARRHRAAARRGLGRLRRRRARRVPARPSATPAGRCSATPASGSARRSCWPRSPTARAPQDPLLTGEVTGLEADYDGTGTFTVIRGYDLGHRLLRQRRVAGVPQHDAPPTSPASWRPQDRVPIGRIQPTKTVYEFITQANVTDWDFLAPARRRERDGDVPRRRGQVPVRQPRPGVRRSRRRARRATRARTSWRPARDILRCRAAVTSADQVADGRGARLGRDDQEDPRRPSRPRPPTRVSHRHHTRRGRRQVRARRRWSRPTRRTTSRREVKNAADALADDVTAAFAELEVTAARQPQAAPRRPRRPRRRRRPLRGQVHGDRRPPHLRATAGTTRRS